MLSTTRQHFLFAETRAKSSCKDLIWIAWVSASPFSMCKASWICRSPAQSTLQYSTSTEKYEMSLSVKHLNLASTCLFAIWLSGKHTALWKRCLKRLASPKFPCKSVTLCWRSVSATSSSKRRPWWSPSPVACRFPKYIASVVSNSSSIARCILSKRFPIWIQLPSMPTKSGMEKHVENQPMSFWRNSVAVGSKDIKMKINNHRSWISTEACASKSISSCNQLQPVFKAGTTFAVKRLHRCSWQKPWAFEWNRKQPLWLQGNGMSEESLVTVSAHAVLDSATDLWDALKLQAKQRKHCEHCKHCEHFALEFFRLVPSMSIHVSIGPPLARIHWIQASRWVMVSSVRGQPCTCNTNSFSPPGALTLRTPATSISSLLLSLKTLAAPDWSRLNQHQTFHPRNSQENWHVFTKTNEFQTKITHSPAFVKIFAQNHVLS